MIKLKELRKQHKLTTTQLAEIIGCTNPTITNYELGNRNPNHDTLIKLADYFDVTVDYLLGREENIWTADDHANGVKGTKKVSINADQKDILDKTSEVLEEFGEKGKELVIEFCDMILEKFK